MNRFERHSRVTQNSVSALISYIKKLPKNNQNNQAKWRDVCQRVQTSNYKMSKF